jgi:hypothetical protein
MNMGVTGCGCRFWICDKLCGLLHGVVSGTIDGSAQRRIRGWIRYVAIRGLPLGQGEGTDHLGICGDKRIPGRLTQILFPGTHSRTVNVSPETAKTKAWRFGM